MSDKKSWDEKEDILFYIYKKYYAYKITNSEWAGAVEYFAEQMSKRELEDLTKRYELKCSKISFSDSDIKNMVFLLVIPIFLCLANLIQVVYSQITSLITPVANLLDEKVGFEEISRVIFSIADDLIKQEFQQTLYILLALVIYVMVVLFVKDSWKKWIQRRKKFYEDMTSAIASILKRKETGDI